MHEEVAKWKMKASLYGGKREMVNTREVVLEMLIEIFEKEKYSHLVTKAVLDKYSYLEKNDRSFIKRLCNGCVERKIQIDYVLNQFSNTKVEKMKPVIRNILRMGVYQILFMDKVPDSAACNEAVKLARKKGFERLKGFVNGVLRNVARNKEELKYPKKEKDLVSYLHITESMPEWIVKLWIEQYGAEKTQDILTGLLKERPLTLRLDESMSPEEKEGLLGQVQDVGVELEQCEELAYAYRVRKVDSLELVPGFMDGKWMVQDLGSMLITQFGNIKEGDTVIDVCGAPGGKALHAASKTGKKGKVYVRDLTDYKVSLIEENLERAGYTHVIPQVMDATILDQASIEKADVVIADLPCSGLGVIGRKPDIKYRVQPQDLEGIAKLQKKILQVVYQYVKPGGTLLYSTCTLNKKENEENVAFITEHLPFELEETKELLPGEGDTDGFYMARFKRK